MKFQLVLKFLFFILNKFHNLSIYSYPVFDSLYQILPINDDNCFCSKSCIYFCHCYLKSSIESDDCKNCCNITNNDSLLQYEISVFGKIDKINKNI